MQIFILRNRFETIFSFFFARLVPGGSSNAIFIGLCVTKFSRASLQANIPPWLRLLKSNLFKRFQTPWPPKRWPRMGFSWMCWTAKISLGGIYWSSEKLCPRTWGKFIFNHRIIDQKSDRSIFGLQIFYYIHAKYHLEIFVQKFGQIES